MKKQNMYGRYIIKKTLGEGAFAKVKCIILIYNK